MLSLVLAGLGLAIHDFRARGHDGATSMSCEG